METIIEAEARNGITNNYNYDDNRKDNHMSIHTDEQYKVLWTAAQLRKVDIDERFLLLAAQ